MIAVAIVVLALIVTGPVTCKLPLTVALVEETLVETIRAVSIKVPAVNLVEDTLDVDALVEYIYPVRPTLVEETFVLETLAE